MKKTNIEKVIIEGFGSIQDPLLFELGRKGVWIVRGENGSGKTTMFSALSWCLYQVNLKGTVNDKVATRKKYQKKGFKGTRVITTFSSSDGFRYMIARHLSYKGETMGLTGSSRLMIFRKSVDDDRSWASEDLVGEELDKNGMQEYINKVLGIDSKTFINSVLFGQRMKRLVESDNDEKRDLLEKLFELDFIAQAKEVAKTKMAGATAKISAKNTEKSLLEGSLVTDRQNLINYEEILSDFEDSKRERTERQVSFIEGRRGLIEETNKSIEKEKTALQLIVNNSGFNKEEYDKLRQDYQKTLDRKNELVREEVEHTSEIGKINLSIQNLKSELSTVATTCNSCGQALKKDSVEVVKDRIRAKIQKEEDAKSIIDFALPKVRKNLESIKTIEKEQFDNIERLRLAASSYDLNEEKKANKQKEIDNMLKEISGFKKDIEEAEKEIMRISQEKKPKVDVEGLKKSISEKEEKIQNLGQDVERLEYILSKLKWWSTTGFGSNGLKSFVFNAMLSNLNHFVQRYVSRFGFSVEFSVDITKASKPFVTKCYENGEEIDYKELSGGEKQRVDIALAFAMHDLVSMQNVFNILILDEVSEGLDDKGVEVIFDLIRVKAGDDKSVFVITHNAVIDSLNTKTIQVKKENFTTFIDED